MFALLGRLYTNLVFVALLIAAPTSPLTGITVALRLRSFFFPLPTNSSLNATTSDSFWESFTLNDTPELALQWWQIFLVVICTVFLLSFSYVARYYCAPVVTACASRSAAVEKTKRFVRHLMGYDPAKPATWSITQLRQYATEHHITIPSGCEKTELVALVDECLTDELLAEHIRKENVLDATVMPDIVAATPAEVLQHVAYPSYAKTLRQHPQALQAILDAGLAQLQSLPFVARLCSAQLHSPLEAWLGHVVQGEDNGLSFKAALTPIEGAAPTSAVCGRFCGDGEMIVRCLDCGADTTCVMCMDCFRHSPCVNHRYRITQSSGSGMCDCGDPTAWKPESFCSRHRTGASAANGGGDDAQTASPLDSLAEEDREWVVIVLRGIIQFIALAILQTVRIEQLRKRAKARRTQQGKKAKADAPAPTPAGAEDEAQLMDDVARIGDNYDWLASWLNTVTRELWDLLSSEVAKHIVSQLWTETLQIPNLSGASAPFPGDHGNEEEAPQSGATSAATRRETVLATLPERITCLHPIFLYQATRPVTDREKPIVRPSLESWHTLLTKCIGFSLSDAKLRLPVGALMATYAECINTQNSGADESGGSLEQFQVQVLTNPDVVAYLMTPSHLPYRNATNTLIHRILSSMLYSLCVAIDQGPRNVISRTSTVDADGLIFVEHQNAYPDVNSISVMHYCVSNFAPAYFTLVMNRLAWRALMQVYGSLAISGYICADPEAPSDSTRFPAPDFSARILSRLTWVWFNAIRAVVANVMKLPVADGCEASAMPHVSPAALTAALRLPSEMWQNWCTATRFDAPPDVSRRRRVLLQMLNVCRVADAEDNALLLLEKGSAAAVQWAALQKHAAAEAGKRCGGHTSSGNTNETTTAGAADAAPAAAGMSPSVAVALGYTVQILYEVSRTMDAFFQKQRDGFCQRCRTIALERDGGAEAAAEALGDEEGNNESVEAGQRTSQAAAAAATDGAADQNEEASSSSSLSSDGDEVGGGAIAPSIPVLPPSQSSLDVLEYNLLEPARHATTFSNHLPHVFGAVLTAWVIEQRRRGTAQTHRSQAADPSSRLSGLCEVSSSGSPDGRLARPLHTLLDCFFRFRSHLSPHPAQDRRTFCQQLLDSLVMPQVLIGQVLDGLWRRDNYSVSVAATMYLTFARSVAAEFDVLMMQVLTLELAPADVAIHILRRFSYAKKSSKAARKAKAAEAAVAAATFQSAGLRRGSGGALRLRHLHFRRYLKGYRYFLRLMLTLVVDTTKAAFDPPLSSSCVERAVAQLLAVKKASHSSIIRSVCDSIRGGDFGDAEDDERDASGNVVKLTHVIDACIKKIAVAQDSQHGKQFRLRDVQTWQSHVSLYHSSMRDAELEEVHVNFRSVALASRAERQKAGEEADNETTDASTRFALPPTQLSDTAMYPELLPATRALLHTDALLLPALYVLHEYTNAHAPPPPQPKPQPSSSAAGSPLTCAGADGDRERASSEPFTSPRDTDVGPFDASSQASTTGTAGSDGDDDSDEEGDDAEDTNLITREALLHALTALHLCVQDCRAITRAMQAAEGDAAGGGAAAAAAASPAISWDLVELYLQRYRVNEVSFTAESCARVLPLPELVHHRTLLHKLRARVSLNCAATSTAKAAVVTESSAEMLHRLRSYLQTNKDADVYSCLEMVEEVLTLTGLATFDTAAATAEQKAKEEAALSRKKLIQDRQAKLMQRMRSRVLKTAVDADPGSTTDGGAKAKDSDVGFMEEIGRPPLGPGTPRAKATGSLLTKVLLELAAVDCCVCHSTTEEPLFLLCHTSTSSVLPQLGALTLPDDRGVHGHLATCGHAAHKTCVEKLFVRLSVLWQRWNFRSQSLLGPTEFNCPLCTMIVTALAPVPSLPSGAMSSPASPAGPSSATSLFEELQAGTVHGDGSDRTQDVVVEFQTTVANSAVGFSPSEDIPALVGSEDELQKHNEAAWILSETMRTFFYSGHVLLESVKAGQAMNHRDLISLLSLLVSVVPAKLQKSHAALRANFERTGEDQESLLLLDALLQPREATHKIRAHVLSRVLSGLPPSYLRQLITCVEQYKNVASSHDSSSPAEAELSQAAERLETVAGAATTMTVWKLLGVLTLLKSLLVEDAQHSIVFSAKSFTVSGTVEFTTLSVPSIQSPVARCTAVLRMLAYLLPATVKGLEEALHDVLMDIHACIADAGEGAEVVVSPASLPLLKSPPIVYTTAEKYVEAIAEQLMHLPRVYAKILTDLAENRRCSVCHKESKTPVMCCRCGQHLCLHKQRSGEVPELYTHVRSCGGAVGMFLTIRQGRFYVMELTSGRLYGIQSNYTDEYGERDRDLRRGVPLFRDVEDTQRLVMLWMQNKWGAVSSVFTASNRIDLTEL